MAPEVLLPQGKQKSNAFHCTSQQEGHISPFQELESQLVYWLAICYTLGDRRHAFHSAQRPNTPHCDCMRATGPRSKSINYSHLSKGRKEVICNTRTLWGVTFPAYHSLRNIAGAPREKKKKQKNSKNPTTRAQGIKTLTKNNSRCINLNEEWNSKTTTLPPKPIPPRRV
jgi:hypothetical protein